jgi:hypothetical protein
MVRRETTVRVATKRGRLAEAAAEVVNLEAAAQPLPAAVAAGHLLLAAVATAAAGRRVPVAAATAAVERP